ncbi:MAG: hypothetical protein J5705_06690 [Bacteroidaceae bacterium]|nr:hypothetical protein [Bacteroidaceae bacterium]
MKKSKLSIVVLSALLIAGVAVVKNQNCKSIVYDNVEALTGGDNGNSSNTETIYDVLKTLALDDAKYTAEEDGKGGYTGYCEETHAWYTPTEYKCTRKY